MWLPVCFFAHHIPSGVYSKGQELGPKGSMSFLFTVALFSEVMQTVLTELSSLEVYPILFISIKNVYTCLSVQASENKDRTSWMLKKSFRDAFLPITAAEMPVLRVLIKSSIKRR